MTAFYDARGNTYFVATPDEIRRFAALPDAPLAAARAPERWAAVAVTRICGRTNAAPTAVGGIKPFRSDGLLVGPFVEPDALALLIVNTDATLAERSGNGLTIFSQYLVDTGTVTGDRPFNLRIYHDTRGAPFVTARVEPAEGGGRRGFWIDMGVPTFGLAAVGAAPEYVGVSRFAGRPVSRVFALETIDAAWTCSVFVNVGNPHCVTFLSRAADLPAMERLGSVEWLPQLTAVANSTASAGSPGAGRPCKNGINLQWACGAGGDVIDARVFERGEGPTLSSGSSATAVASAARELGLIDRNTVNVRMPGGIAPVRFDERDGALERVMLFGEAQRANPSD